MTIYNSIKKLKETLTQKIQRRLKVNNPNFDVDNEVIGDFIDSAINIIKQWRKLDTNETEFLEGLYDNNIIQYVVEVYNRLGLEGQSTDNALGNGKSFVNSPENNLKSSIPQRI